MPWGAARTATIPQLKIKKSHFDSVKSHFEVVKSHFGLK